MGTITLQNISKSYGQTVACSDIHINVEEGEFFSFLGPSGCGKTTTLRLIAGFLDPDHGKIIIGGQDMTHVPAEKRQVGMVFQNYALFPFMTVYENVEYALKIKKLPQKIIQEKVQSYLEMVKLKGYEKRAISELSGGEQQRVALARSLAMEPKVLLLDEPLSNLDAKLRLTMRREMQTLLKKLKITTIFVTHDQTEALSMSDRIAVFNKGKCIQIGSPEEIYNNPTNAFVARFIGDTNIWPLETIENNPQLSKLLTFNLSGPKVGSYLLIRPQEVLMHKEDRGEEEWFKGIVVGQHLTGVFKEYKVEVNGTILKVVKLNQLSNDLNISVGDEVYLSVHWSALKILKE